MKDYSVYKVTLFLAFLCSMALSACSDHSIAEPEADNSDLIALSANKIMAPRKASFRTVKVEPAEEVGEINVSSDVDWIHIMDEKLAADGYSEFFIERDDEGLERTGKVLFTAFAADGTRVSSCVEITQGADTGNNDEIPAPASARVGYGYNIFGVFRNDASVMNPIIREDFIANPTMSSGLIESSNQSDMKIEKTTSRTLDEMAYLLTEKEEKSKSGIRGASKTVKIHESISSYSADEQQFAHIQLSKSVGVRSLDVGILSYLIDRGDQVFSPEFKEIRRQIIESPTKEKINMLLSSFGTHMVVYAEIGCSLDLSINFSRQMKGTLSMRTEDFSDYFLKNRSSEFLLSDGTISDLTCTVTPNTNCIMTGGAKTARANLSQDIKTHGRPTQNTLQDWLASVKADNFATLEPVNFQLVPIWSLFPSECVSAIMQEVNNLSTRSNNHYTSTQIGTDYYEIDFEFIPEMFRFGTKENSSLVKVLYVSDDLDTFVPIMEICEEYVPHIRCDRRIPVIYGLRNGRPFHGAGFFPGDGEGNPPAWLTFSNGEVYVKPESGAGGRDKATRLYYLHGNIYTSDYGISTRNPPVMGVKDVMLALSKKYPIVKIGSGYWTRCDIRESLGFEKSGKDAYGDKYSVSYEKIDRDGILFANIFYTNSETMLRRYNNIFGPDEDPVTRERTLWYLPRRRDVWNLKEYLDDNPRELLKKRNSGFEADFRGLYGAWNVFTSKSLSKYDWQFKGNYCFIPCKDEYKSSTGATLALSKDYTLSTLPIDISNENFYPVRLFRTPYFRYKEMIWDEFYNN